MEHILNLASLIPREQEAKLIKNLTIGRHNFCNNRGASQMVYSLQKRNLHIYELPQGKLQVIKEQDQRPIARLLIAI